jgi:60 kDa SS-A/Ro ribonucleoprotein
VNKTLFNTIPKAPPTPTFNEAGGKAYKRSDKGALALFAATGCLNSTFYADAETQLKGVLGMVENVDPSFAMKVAVHARTTGYMKDMPATILAKVAARKDWLAVPENAAAFAGAFSQVCDNGKMLRNFVQVVRSSVTGRKSFGTMLKKLIRKWLEGRNDHRLFRDSVGQSPSMADVIKMVHPRPLTASRRALYGYLLNRDPVDAKTEKVRFDINELPPLVKAFEKYKTDRTGETPEVPFQMLTALNLGTEQWTEIARRGGWQMVRMNLNTFARHGVFKDKEMIDLVAEKLRDREAITQAKVFPYQLFTAFKYADTEVPREIVEALQDAAEIAVENVPLLVGEDGKPLRVFILPDVSGSMRSPVTGLRKGATSKIECVEAAAVAAVSIIRKNRLARMLPFDDSLYEGREFNPRDSIMTLAKKLAGTGGGGTNCSLPLRYINNKQLKADLVIFLSDNESWVDGGRAQGTATMQEFLKLKHHNPNAKLVCIDMQPCQTSQIPEGREDVLQVAGYSDGVFDVIASFVRGGTSKDYWVGEIEKTQLILQEN